MVKCVSEWTRVYMTLQTHTQHHLKTRHLEPIRQHMLSVTHYETVWWWNDKCGTSDRPLNDHDDSCVTMLTTLCVCEIYVYIMNKNQTQAFNITGTRSQAWHNNQHDEDDSLVKKWQGSNTCRGNKWNDFLCLRTSMLLRTWWYDNDKQSCKLK